MTVLLYIFRNSDQLIEDVKISLNLTDDINATIQLLIRNDLITLSNNKFLLTKKGINIVNYLTYSVFDISNFKGLEINEFVLEDLIGKGATSVTYKAIIKRTGKVVVIKIFYPEIIKTSLIEFNLKNLVKIHNSFLVIPNDWGEFNYEGIKLNYIIMEFIHGISLNEFLDKNMNIDIKETLANYILEIGEVLNVINEHGYYHGDLHDKNILVVEDEIKTYRERNIYHFKVIDFVGIPLAIEKRKYEKSDFDYFTENFIKIINTYCLTPSNEIDIKALGNKFYYIYENIIKSKYFTIKEIISSLSNNISTNDIIDIEKPYTYLIFEEYDTDKTLWIERFEPDFSIYSHFLNFNSIICSGPRGCGKTIYLHSLSFIPKLIKKLQENDYKYKSKINYYNRIFGIYFPCRQGEFKYFSNKQYNFHEFKTQLFLKHILILKIIRKTFSLISESYECKLFASYCNFKPLFEFIREYLINKNIALTNTSQDNPFKEITTIIRNEENECTDKLGIIDKYPSQSKMLNETILIDYFGLIRENIAELNNHKFYIIFDDLSEPQVNLEVQKILNCLIACHNKYYCCKFSTDKYAYTFEDMFGKALQTPHDYEYIDMSNVPNYEKYLEKIINKQLQLSGYKKNVNEIFDQSPFKYELLIEYLSKKKYDNVIYAGWKLIVQLSSNSVRDGLAICESIFKNLNKQEITLIKEGIKTISPKIQSLGITNYSEDVYAALINIEAVGKEIFDVVRNFGEISRIYLQRDITTKKGRKYEVITIERRDSVKLNKKAENLLSKLIRHSVFLNKGFSFSREQMGLVEKFTLHKKYTPKLKTTYREREHLRLDHKSLEKLLTNPDKYRDELLSKNAFDENQLKLFIE